MTSDVSFHPLARDDLIQLCDYIEQRSGPNRAGRFIDRIETFCLGLSTMPDRGLPREDLGAGVRTLSLDRRVLVVDRASPGALLILRVVYAGKQFEAEDIPNIDED